MAPIAAYDIAPDGGSRRLDETAIDSGPEPGAGATWRWLHHDAAEPATRLWLERHLPGTVARALLQVETRPRCDRHGEGLILNLRGVNTNPGAQADDMVSVRLWVTDRYVISTRFRRIFACEEISNRCETGDAPASPGAFLVALVAELTGRIDGVASELEELTDDVEDRLLDRSDVTEDLSPLRASAIKLRRFVSPQREALQKLAQVQPPILEDGHRESMLEVADRTTRAVEGLEAVAQRLDALQDHASAQMAQKMARHGNVLSVVAAIFLPLSFLTGLFGVNLGGIPGEHNVWGFALLSLASLVIGVLLAVWFRRRGWF